ncbi:TonB-dependent receptor [Aestuariibacter sp. AA17]|uniref:TonB-dependent receptor n=1 Tax=Fluctibacter corallii TaxID=2984329 RepID=A0ABT3A862_9ALTE|nr:TonB-dependent receptor plug domain-containing protein [Aestuariibacter sp. AA17]MCV2884777.1 TonB-dependent receptor [Aestuariibacter sp. AA17]
MKHTSIHVALCAAFLSATSNPALSEVATHESSQAIEKITVVASKTAMPVEAITSSVQIITADHIDALGYISIADILNTATSVNVSNAGGVGKNTTVRIRGEEGYRTQLYLDGIAIADPTAPQVSPIFDDILTNQISRVEILRGAQGLAYGADAGGVISMFSRGYDRHDGVNGQLHLELGSDDTQHINTNLIAGSQSGTLSLSVSDLSTDGFNARKDDTSNEKDGYDNTTVHITGSAFITDHLTARFVVRSTDAESEYDGCYDNITFAQINRCESRFDGKTARASLEGKWDTQQHQIALAKTDITRDFHSNNLFSFGNEGAITQFDYAGQVNAFGTTFLFGGDIEKQENQQANTHRYQRGAFIESVTEAYKDVYFNAGLRHDNNDSFGEHTSYRFGTSYKHELDNRNTLTFKASKGTGFRAPSLYEQDYNLSDFAWGAAKDLQLDEELSESIDAGVIYSHQHTLMLALTYFKQDIENEIYYDGISHQGYLQQPGRSQSKGYEASLEWELSNQITLHSNYTYNKATDNQSQPRIRRPKHSAHLGLLTTWLDGKVSVNGFVKASRIAQGIGGEALSNIYVFDLTARYSPSDNVSIQARVNNAFDRAYTEVLGYNTAGRNIYVGATYQF